MDEDMAALAAANYLAHQEKKGRIRCTGGAMLRWPLLASTASTLLRLKN
jgi:hypothetical protein